MTAEIWLAFVAASVALVVIPGPTVLLVVSYALGQGWLAALPMAVGVALGDFTAMSLSVLGIGALLMASAAIFTFVKWIGAAYLVYLGIKLFLAGGHLSAEPKTGASNALRMAAHAWLVTSLNPKGILFFVAFFPQTAQVDLGSAARGAGAVGQWGAADRYRAQLQCQPHHHHEATRMSGVYLSRRDPSRNLARFYRMLIVPTLFEEWVLLREWGRIGSGGTVRADPFPNAGAALLAMQATLRAKLKRGYRASESMP